MIKTITIILCILTLLIIFIRPVNANAPERSISEYTNIELVSYFATLYGANRGQLEGVINCESGWRPTVYGDGGHAYGLLQFHKPTFEMWEKQMGEDMDYYSSFDQIKMGAWAFSKGYTSHWTCYTKLYK